MFLKVKSKFYQKAFAFLQIFVIIFQKGQRKFMFLEIKALFLNYLLFLKELSAFSYDDSVFKNLKQHNINLHFVILFLDNIYQTIMDNQQFFIGQMTEKRNWSEFEDQTLIFLKETQKITTWKEIAEKMTQQYKIFDRTGKQCRQRYHNHLLPTIQKGRWTDQEFNTLVNLHKKFGNRWALIAKHLPGRADNNVKNNFYARLKRGLKVVNSFMKRSFKKFRPFQEKILFKLQRNGYFKERKNITEDSGRDQKALVLDVIPKLFSFTRDQYFKQKTSQQMRKQIIQVATTIDNATILLKKEKKRETQNIIQVQTMQKKRKYQKKSHSDIISKKQQLQKIETNLGNIVQQTSFKKIVDSGSNQNTHQISISIEKGIYCHNIQLLI